MGPGHVCHTPESLGCEAALQNLYLPQILLSASSFPSLWASLMLGLPPSLAPGRAVLSTDASRKASPAQRMQNKAHCLHWPLAKAPDASTQPLSLRTRECHPSSSECTQLSSGPLLSCGEGGGRWVESKMRQHFLLKCDARVLLGPFHWSLYAFSTRPQYSEELILSIVVT